MAPSSQNPPESDLLATRYSLPTPSSGLDAFLAELLSEQQKLQTPVTRAATAHALQPSAWRSEKFRELVPLTAPGPGQQYAFEVDLDSCSGCKACVSGCHSLNGLDDEETWRDVGVVLAGRASPNDEARIPNPNPAPPAPSPLSPTLSSFGLSDQRLKRARRPSDFHGGSAAVAQTVTTACHHCEDPACLNGCPVLAYEKDPVTGIVRHLDDQCIGCSYCVLKCPYDVPKYNKRLGIVRKCDLCHGRLAAGEAPACAQACPTQAIKIVLVPGSAGLQPSSPPSAPTPYDAVIRLPADPSYTRPTTRYVSKRPLPPGLHAADAHTLRPQPCHLALVFLLVGTQLALGLLMTSLQVTGHTSHVTSIAAALLFFAALAASVAHLGQPLRAWRVFLGLRRSWLSREAVILGLAAPLVALSALITFLPSATTWLTNAVPACARAFAAFSDLVTRHSSLVTPAAIAATAAGVFCSAMIYIDTRRRFWRPANTFARMGGTVLVAAFAFAAPPIAALALAAKLTWELTSACGLSVSARLQRGPLRRHLLLRLTCAVPALALFALHFPLPAFVFFTVGELLERALYFRAVDAPKMPGLSAS